MPAATRRPGPSSPGPSRATLAVLGALLLVVAGVIGGLIANATDSTTATVTAPAVSAGSTCDATTIAERDLPSVVTIFAGSGGGGTGASVGSGEIIKRDGYILTNNHVVAPAAGGGPLEVVFNDGSSAAARIVGRDPLTDLAVIKVSGVSGLRPIGIGDSEKARIGQGVVVLGAPLGLSSTVTSGIISSLGRAISVPGEGSQSALLIDAIQTDAAINPGNSGGAMVNCQGELLGIPTAGANVSSSDGGGSIGVGFAIPVNSAMRIGNELIANGRVTHAFIGIQTQPLGASAAGEAGPGQGLLVLAVTAGGPSAAAGLREGDVITRIDGQQAVSTDQLMAVTLTRRPGDKLQLEYTRNGRQANATITLAAR